MVLVIVDEAQAVVRLPVEVGDILAQSRSKNVAMLLAHQHLSQLPPALRAGLQANARTKVVFQSARQDAETWAKTLAGGLKPADLMALPAFEAYAALVVRGQVQPPLSLRTRPLPESLGTAPRVRAQSRRRYGQDAVDVQAGTEPDQAGSGPIGRKERSS